MLRDPHTQISCSTGYQDVGHWGSGTNVLHLWRRKVKTLIKIRIKADKYKFKHKVSNQWQWRGKFWIAAWIGVLGGQGRPLSFPSGSGVCEAFKQLNTVPLKPRGVKYAFFCRRPLNRHGARQYPIVSRYNAHYHAAAGLRKYEKTHTKYKFKISIPYDNENKKNPFNISRLI